MRPFFIFFSAAVVLTLARGQVVTINLELGEERELTLDSCSVANAYSSAESVVSVWIIGDKIRIRGQEFGSSTVTVFCQSGHRIFHVLVPSHSAAPPRLDKDQVTAGSDGSVGTRISFRSTKGLFDERVGQEEFVRFSERKETFTQTGVAVSVDPIFQAQPKASRYFEQLYWEYRRNDRSLFFRLGDFNPLQKAVPGVARGLRADVASGPFSTGAFVGVLRSGVGNVLTGSKTSGIAGIGEDWQISRPFKISVAGVTFEEHRELSLMEPGWEAEFRGGFHGEYLSSIELGVVSDRYGKLAWDTQVGIDLSPLTVSVSGAKIPNGMAVYSLPSRFADGNDLFGLQASLSTDPSVWHLGVGVGQSSSFSQIDGFPGATLLRSASLDARGRIWRLLTSVSFNIYESQFEPFSVGAFHGEKGGRALGEIDWELERGDYATLKATAHAIEASREGFNYENQQISGGFKTMLGAGGKNSIHFEAGVSHFYYPADLSLGGEYLLSKVSSVWDAGFLKLDGMIQGETRVAGDLRHTLRFQGAFAFIPTPRDEIRLVINHNLEWMREVYSNARGFYLFYAHHFGSHLPDTPTPPRWEKAVIRGRSYIDKNQSSSFEASDVPVVNAEIVLMGPALTRQVFTGSDGSFRLSELEPGEYVLTFRGPGLPARLVSETSERIVLKGETVRDFIYNDRSEVIGRVFDDQDGDGNHDALEPLIGASLIGTIQGEERSIEAEGGQFRVLSLAEGEIQFRVDPASLPSGYHPGKEITVQVPANAIVKASLAVKAERLVSGQVFRDTNGNGMRDRAESGIDGIIVQFGKRKAKTGEGGQFIFRNLPPMKGSIQFGRCRSVEIRVPDEPTAIANVPLACP